MLRPPSLQTEYTLVYSEDPALLLPDDREEARNLLRVARETGRWDAILRPDAKPTVFTIRPLGGSALTWLRARTLTDDQAFELVLRLTLLKIANLGDLKLKFEDLDGFVAVARESIDAIYDLGRDIGEPMLGRRVVFELGALILDRAVAGVPPKP